MKQIITYICLFLAAYTWAQEEKSDKVLAAETKKANDLIYDANALVNNDDFISAEMEYRKAISGKPSSVAGTYNLGHSYYVGGNFDEALYRNQQALKNAKNKDEKHRIFHNIGNILMQNKKCPEAVEAFKNALRNDPSDDESRYNLGLAKDCAKKQGEEEEDDKDDKDKDKEEDKDEEEKEQEKEEEGQDKENEKDKGQDDKKPGEDEQDKGGEDKEEKKEEGDGDKEEQKKPQQQPGQLSPQQIKNLLEAMNNQEQKVQEKINAQKTKGVKLQTEKDW